jgi:hypothetical protein
MLALRSPDLLAELLDPADPSERSLQGSRYAWGGYVWQVRDARSGTALLSGPEWPEARPDPFNGQGLPESFRHAAWPDQKPLTVFDGRGFVLGAGEVEPGPGGAPVVVRPCDWEVSGDASALSFSTRQAALGWECRIARGVSLAGRTLASATRVENTGSKPLPLHWFAHPFFALTQGVLTCGLPEGYGCEENPGFAMGAGNRLVFRRRFNGLRDGHFQLLTMRGGAPLRAEVSHPGGRAVVLSTDFAPDLCPVWGNGNTWSIEPYLMTTLAPGGSRSWTLRYEFGA